MVFETVLGEIAECQSLSDLKITAVDRNKTGEDLEQGRFTGTIFTAQADPVTGADMPVDGIKDQPSGIIFCHFS